MIHKTLSDLLNWIVRQNEDLQLLIFALHGLAVCALCIVLLRIVQRRISRPADFVPAGPSFVAVTTLFSLLLAFHASEVWNANSRAKQDFVLMDHYVHRLWQLASKTEVDSAEARKELVVFLRAVVDEEWLANHNARASDTAVRALINLQAIAARLAKTMPDPNAQLMQGVLYDIARARAEKFSLSGAGPNYIAWTIIIALGLVAHLSLMAVNLDKPRAAITILVLFSVATTFAYWAVAIDELPYRKISSYGLDSWRQLIATAESTT